MRRQLLCFGVAAAVVALLSAGGMAAAPERDVLVRHGVGIGKLRLGMTVAQVKSVIGAPRAVNKRERRGTRGYVYLELDWDYAWWTVGFMRPPGGRYRAVSIATIQRGQRTPERLGIGSTERELARRLGVRCRLVMPAQGWVVMQRECVHGARGRGQTVFVIGRETGFDPADQPVTQVEVRAPLFYRGWPVRFCPVQGAC